ncbi:hypothetical protein RSSM_01194 [Rhodopirellula sallentina SM41]|uniref:Uncharacterized protein n=1 Tax=Rhodopirellula sallentina SM41 TaxID=1263870 RepID=M5UMW5_9BACT|nr:hypothetical protein RSSM_01194 [Rhodopirellula sallentina SM41]
MNADGCNPNWMRRRTFSLCAKWRRIFREEGKTLRESRSCALGYEEVFL